MEARGRRPRRRDEGGFSSDEGHEGGGYGYGRGGGGGYGYGDDDEEAHQGRIQDMGQAFVDLLYGYAVDKAHIIPTRPKKLSSLASRARSNPHPHPHPHPKLCPNPSPSPNANPNPSPTPTQASGLSKTPVQKMIEAQTPG